MKKSLLLKTLASLSAVAVLGVSTLVGASAAGDTLNLKIADVTGMAGDTVEVAISAENNPGLEGIGGKIQFDEALTIDKTAKPGSLLGGGLFMIDPESDNFIFAGSAMEVSGDTEGTIGIINFTIPEDAEPGTVYELNWDFLDDYSNAEGSVNSASITLVNGSITVEGEPGTTPAVTEEVTEETTTPATEDVAPKTGASTKGIAATSAVLLAAACSAVALKKKRD
jgi:hypothetical protein